MRIAIYGIYQSAMSQKVHLGAVHKKLLDIAVDNHSQLFFREKEVLLRSIQKYLKFPADIYSKNKG